MIMQRLKGRSVVFGALAVLACSGDPTGNESTPTQINANPDVVFVTQGDSSAVIVSVVDEDGQILQADPTVSNVGAGISVNLDPNFQAVTTENPIRRQARFFVKATDLTSTTFTINASGLTKQVQVVTVPGALNATITDTVPALGSPVTVTLPTGVFFTDSSELTVNGVVQIVQAQDNTAGTITFLPAPNSNGPVVVSNLGISNNPNLVFTLATPELIHTDSITVFPSTVSSLTPVGSQPVTLTSTDARFTFGPTSQMIIAADSALTTNVAATTLTVIPEPGSLGTITVKDVFVGGYPLTLTSTTIDTVTVGPEGPSSSIPGTNSVATAPTIDLVVGSARGVVDQVSAGEAGGACGAVFGGGCQVYKFTVPADDSVFVTTDFEGDSDVGVYFFLGDDTDFAVPPANSCDQLGGGAGLNKPEVCAFGLLAGTYLMRVVPFGPGLPAWVRIRMSIH
jgi:hypothetical protein